MQIDHKTNYRAIEQALSLSPGKVIERVDAAGLAGRGGASFPTARKWAFTRQEPNEPKILICNADEGEPGTFKDRYIIRNNPNALIEGMCIAAYAIGARRGYIYLRAEYDNIRHLLEEAIDTYQPYLDRISFQLDIFLGQGAYICGEETAIMNSIEGLRGEPRAKPPYPAKEGLFGLPTCVNNVSTLTNAALILDPDCDWIDKKMFSLSGNVTKPSIYEYKTGISSGELIDRGEPEHPIKALLFGAAGGFVPYEASQELDREALAEKGAFLGSYTVIAIDERQSIPEICRNLADFFVHESCGRCTPCREGNYQIRKLLGELIDQKGSSEHLTLLEELSDFIPDCAFCGLGQTSTNYLKTSLTYFREEFEAL